jgi:hypothetical protein
VPEDHAEQVERPQDSRYYDVRHEQYEQVPQHERKDGEPSPTPEHDAEIGGWGE